MQELSLEEIHQYGLGCLIYFDKICQKHALRYSLGHGTLIGAVRHQGFIPWDDDIDVLMLRDDYEKFSKLFRSNSEYNNVYGFINEKNNEQYHYTIGRIIDKRTQIRFTSNESDVNGMGVFIDIYPVDYIPENAFVRRIFNYLFSFIVIGLLISAQKRYSCSSSVIWKSWTKKMLFSILCMIGKKNLYSIYYLLLECLPAKSSRVDDVWDRFYMLDKEFNPEWFNDLILYPFEGYNFYGFKEADTFLRNHYGDYMQFPPKEQQKPHHNYKAYLI